MECQQEDWPRHKLGCSKDLDIDTIQNNKIIKNFMDLASPFLVAYCHYHIPCTLQFSSIRMGRHLRCYLEKTETEYVAHLSVDYEKSKDARTDFFMITVSYSKNFTTATFYLSTKEHDDAAIPFILKHFTSPVVSISCDYEGKILSLLDKKSKSLGEIKISQQQDVLDSI